MDICGGCKKMNATTYKDQNVIDEMNEWFVLLKQDLIKGQRNQKIIRCILDSGFLFLEQNGNSFYHFNGYLRQMNLGQC